MLTVKEHVLSTFERHRKITGAPFNEMNFMDYLIDSPKGKRAIHNSFSGLKRFNAFWDEVQITQGICFSLKDRDRNYSLNEFVARIEELKKNPKASKAALKHQMKFGYEWNIFAFFNLILCSIVIATLKWLPVTVITLLVAAFANYKFLGYYFKEKWYKERLWERLNKEEII